MKVLSLCLFLSCSFLFGQELIVGRFYVSPESIHFTENQITVEFNGQALPVTMIGVDRFGLYAIQDGVNMIFCPKCEELFDSDNQSMKCPHGWKIKN